MNKIKAVGIIGSGINTAHIATLCALKNFQIRIYDLFKDSLNMTSARTEWMLKDNPTAVKNIESVQEIDKLSGADIILQVDDYKAEDKFALFKKLSEIIPSPRIIALNCYAETITDFVSEMVSPERFTAFCFNASGGETSLVEIIKTQYADADTLENSAMFLKSLGNVPLIVEDMSGLVIGRLRRSFIVSAARILEKGKGLPFEIDNAFKKLTGCGKGPFETVDELGLDKNFKLAKYMSENLDKAERLKISSIEDRLTQYGYLGKKSGLGFYIYDEGKIAGQNPMLKDIVSYLGISKIDENEVVLTILKDISKEAELISKDMEIPPDIIDESVKLVFGWKLGPFGFAEKFKDLLTAADTKDDWGDAL